MKSGKTSLKSQKEGEHFCKQVVERRKMRNDFDNSYLDYFVGTFAEFIDSSME